MTEICLLKLCPFCGGSAIHKHDAVNSYGCRNCNIFVATAYDWNERAYINDDVYRPGIVGCSDHNCIFQDNSKGMHTNGGCQCERELRRHPQGFKAIQTINFLRRQISNAG